MTLLTLFLLAAVIALGVMALRWRQRRRVYRLSPVQIRLRRM